MSGTLPGPERADGAAGSRLVLEAAGTHVEIDPAAGGRVASLQVDGWELLVGRDAFEAEAAVGDERPTERPIFGWGNFAIAPFVGRLRGGMIGRAGRDHHLPLNAPPHAIHGLVTDRPWHVVDRGLHGTVVLEVDLPAAWPWTGRVRQEIEVHAQSLVSRLALIADEPMPASIGWHPWFARHARRPDGATSLPLELDIAPGPAWEVGPDELPTGRLVAPGPRPWDTCFSGLAGTPVLRWPGLLELRVDSDCAAWVVYERDPAGICVEPWTAPPGALLSWNPPTASPEGSLSAWMRWSWRPLTD